MTTSLRIALYHNLPSGGASRTIHETVRRLAQRHYIDQFCPSTADRTFLSIEAWVASSLVMPFSHGKLYRSPLGRLNNLVRLAALQRLERLQHRAASIIDQRGYDVVLVHPCMITQAPSILRYSRTPTVYYCHEVLRGLYETPIIRPYIRDNFLHRALDRIDLAKLVYQYFVKRIDRLNVRSSDYVLTNSEFTRQAIQRVYAVQSVVNRPGVDAKHFRPLAVDPKKIVLSVGALKPEKGFDFLIHSLSTIAKEHRPSLHIASNSENPGERQYLNDLAELHQVNLTFRQGITDEELIQLYNHSMYIVYAPVREPLGLVPLEAQACQTPVVGVAEGGVLETVLHNQTGILVKRDAEAFGHAVSSLLSDRVRRDTYGRCGRSHVSAEWNWEKSVVQLEERLVAAAEHANHGLRCIDRQRSLRDTK